MAEQILTFRPGPKTAKSNGAQLPVEDTDGQQTRTDPPHSEPAPETLELISRGRRQKLRMAKLLWVFHVFSGLRLADVLGRPKNRIQFVLWLMVLSITGVSALAVVLGTLEHPQTVQEIVDEEGFEETIEVADTPQQFRQPEESIAIAPGPDILGQTEQAVGIAERLDAGPGLTQMSADISRSETRGAWLEGTIQDDVVETAPFGR